MKRSVLLTTAITSAVTLLAAPAVASADVFDAVGVPDTVGINSMWVFVAACLVLFMQAGFALLEIGFSRGKNAGTVVAKILTNFSIAAIVYWAVGFALAFGGASGKIIGTEGFFLRDYGDPTTAFPVMGFSDATVESKWFFQFVFCAVSLAIVWGTTLERIKFGVYVIFAVIFAGLIYPSPPAGFSAAAGCRPTSACRTSPVRPPSISSAQQPASRYCCCSARAKANTTRRGDRGRSPATTCRSSALA